MKTPPENTLDYLEARRQFLQHLEYMQNKLDEKVEAYFEENPNLEREYINLPDWMKYTDNRLDWLAYYFDCAEATIKHLERERHEAYSEGIERGKELVEPKKYNREDFYQHFHNTLIIK